MQIRHSLAIATMVVASACTYTLEEVDYMVDVKKPEPKGTISLEAYPDKDTIFLARETDFVYQIADVNQQYSVTSEVLYDDIVIQTSQNNTGYFRISAGRLSTGTHKLKIRFKAPSGTGSLADRNFNENIEVWREWTVITDIDPPPVPVITKSIENGFLKLSWPKYTKKNFVKYTVTTSYHPVLGYNQFELADPNKNSFVDTTYSAGYGVSYLITVENQIKSESTGIVVNEPQSFTYVYNPDSTIDMKWRKVKYFSAFKSFVVSVDLPGATNPNTTTITNASDTTLHVKAKVVFPHNLDVKFKMIDKFGVERFSQNEGIFNPSNAPQTENASAWYYNPTLGKIMSYDGGLVRIRNNSSLETEKSFYVPEFSMPWPGRFMYYVWGSAIGQRNLVTDELKLVNIPGIYSVFAGARAVNGADNGLADFDAFDLTERFDQRYIRGTADMSTSTILGQNNVSWDPKLNNPPVVNQFSDDGRFIYMRNGGFLNSVSGTTRTYIGNFQNVGGFFMFRPDNNDEIITSYGETNIVRSSDLAILRTLTLPETGCVIRGYDPVTKHVLYYKSGSGKGYVVNIDTGAWKVINADVSDCFLIHGYLISRSGHYLKVL